MTLLALCLKNKLRKEVRSASKVHFMSLEISLSYECRRKQLKCMHGRIRDEYEENIMLEQERFFSWRSHVDGNLHSKLILMSLAYTIFRPLNCRFAVATFHFHSLFRLFSIRPCRTHYSDTSRYINLHFFTLI